MKRKKTAPIETVAQMRIATSPTTHEVLEALQLGGPASVAELGPRLGRRANSLHYHVGKLLKAKMVVRVGSRRSGARTQAIFDVVADQFVGPSASSDKHLQEATNEAVSAMLRVSSRDFIRAAEDPESLSDEGPQRNILADRLKSWLTPEQLREANEHVDALVEIFRSSPNNNNGQLHVLTMVMSPIRQTVVETSRTKG